MATKSNKIRCAFKRYGRELSARIRRKARSGVYSSTCLMPSTTHCYCCSATRRARTRAHPSNVTRYHRVIKGLFLGADCSPPPPSSVSFFFRFNGILCVPVTPLRGTCAALDNCPPLLPKHQETTSLCATVCITCLFSCLSAARLASAPAAQSDTPSTSRPSPFSSLRNNNNPTGRVGVPRKTATFIPDSGHTKCPNYSGADPSRLHLPRNQQRPFDSIFFSGNFQVFHSFSVRRTGSGCCPTFAKSQPAGRSHSNSFRGGEGWLRAKGGEFY